MVRVKSQQGSHCASIKQLRSRGLTVVEVTRQPKPDYNQDHIDWLNYGVVALVTAGGICVTKFEFKINFNTFEHLCCRITSAGRSYMMVVVCRPGSQKVILEFYIEF